MVVTSRADIDDLDIDEPSRRRLLGLPNEASPEEQARIQNLVALLAAENASLRGQRAARSPSPPATTGAPVVPVSGPPYRSIHHAAAEAAGELGYRLRG